MRILHVAESVLGGCGTYLNELVPLQLNDLGCDNIRLVVPYQHLSHLAAVDGSAMLPFQRKSRAIGIFHLTVSTIQAISHLRPEIVHAHSSIAGFVVRVCCALWRSPPIVIYCSHGWAFEFSRSKLLRNIAAKCERFLARFCDRIVAISDADREEGEIAGIPAKKIVVFHNGISATLPSLEAACWPQPGRKILFVGRLDFQKGLDILLSALSGLDDSFVLRIVGDTVVSKKSMVLEQIPRAEHLGWLNQTDVFRQMNACDVVVVPSRWEGFGMVAIEAMRAGKPVIASAVGGLKEIVVDGVTGRLVRSEDPEALKAALQMDTVEQLRSMGNAGRTRFLRDFTSDRLHQDLLGLYASEVSLRSKGAGPLFTIEGGQVN